jgi:hypothetical protein
MRPLNIPCCVGNCSKVRNLSMKADSLFVIFLRKSSILLHCAVPVNAWGGGVTSASSVLVYGFVLFYLLYTI